MVDLRDYHVALLEHMRHWFQSPCETQWVDIKTALAPTQYLHLLLVADP